MKKFLVLYTSEAVASGLSVAEMFAKTSPDQMEAGMALWKAWYEKCSGSIVDQGAPTANGLEVNGPSSAPSGLPVSGYSILQAESVDQARQLMEDHPHFHMPGSAIEIFECLHLPGMG